MSTLCVGTRGSGYRGPLKTPPIYRKGRIPLIFRLVSHRIKALTMPLGSQLPLPVRWSFDYERDHGVKIQ